jgi:hypothetical protein
VIVLAGTKKMSECTEPGVFFYENGYDAEGRQADRMKISGGTFSY